MFYCGHALCGFGGSSSHFSVVPVLWVVFPSVIVFLFPGFVAVFQLPSGPGGGLSSGAALLRRVLPALVSGFELASLSGPLAEEPVR